MEFEKVVRRRRMVRRFEQRPVPGELIDSVLEAARHAPSAGFSQGFDFVVIDRPELIQRFYDLTNDPKFPHTADDLLGPPGVLVFPLANKRAYLDRYSLPDKAQFGLEDETLWPVPYWELDTAMAVMLILLAAVDAGLGAFYFGMNYGEREVMREFGVPAGYKPIGVVGLGFAAADEPFDPSRFAKRRRSLQEMIHRNRW